MTTEEHNDAIDADFEIRDPQQAFNNVAAEQQEEMGKTEIKPNPNQEQPTTPNDNDDADIEWMNDVN